MVQNEILEDLLTLQYLQRLMNSAELRRTYQMT